ncbi:YceI family protein [Asticcacaulis taihuensis]|uniref:Polyisoprenoid-binding protein YceI n=1 Tax=Asticcacaulis taihuensis TaxID=260084 RepID=A0A1G4TT34_9CAUL|nr:YceI family protein [Asticcacaulis taihuensis]SCW83759.1 Polyisoprenoid-binding protein YceI [Asticcacaulis taihuensis]
MFRFATVCLAFGLMTTPAFAADTLTFEPDHTSVVFQYPHFGMSHPSGKIMGATGTLVLDKDDPANSTVDITLDMKTLTTALPDFDTLLKSEKYFDIAQFPTATFKSTNVELTGENTANITGDLTIHGITQNAVLAVTFNKKAFNPALFKTGYGFSATAHLSRKAFGLGNLEPIVGDDIDLIIDAEVY